MATPSLTIPLILSLAQVEAVLGAMAHLNNVDATCHVRLPFPSEGKYHFIHVKEFMTDQLQIWVGDIVGNHLVCSQGYSVENYASQTEFAIAYGVQQ